MRQTAYGDPPHPVHHRFVERQDSAGPTRVNWALGLKVGRNRGEKTN